MMVTRKVPVNTPKVAAPLSRFQSLDLLATLVAVVSGGHLLFVNAALEDALGFSRRSVAGTRLSDFYPARLADQCLVGRAGQCLCCIALRHG